jgi:hypothetical protein
MASRLTPVSASLVSDDPRFIDAAEQLLGGRVIPECPEGDRRAPRQSRCLPGEHPRVCGCHHPRRRDRLRPAHLARQHRRPGPAGLDGGLPALPRDRCRARPDAAVGA